jgi:DNA sulfur modification protein DndE
MTLSLIDVTTTVFRTTRSGERNCEILLRHLGQKTHYIVARLAIARSLGVTDPLPASAIGEDEEGTRTIRGHTLFGEGADLAAWTALLVQRAGYAEIDRRGLQRLVAAHWHRGAELLSRDWEEAGGSLALFIERLAEAASMPETGAGRVESDAASRLDEALTGEIVLPVGEVAEDAATGEPVAFPLNVPAGSPHVAVMGGVGSGKTRTAAQMLKRLRQIGRVPLLAFDFKGDLASTYGLDTAFDAAVLTPPRTSVPLDVLAAQTNDDTALKEAAGRIRDSIARVKATRLGGMQADALREAVLRTLRTKRPATLADIGRMLEAEYEQRERKPDELVATLRELNQFSLFEPRLEPSEFFTRSWIVTLPPETPGEVRRLVINLTLDALDRWLNSLPEAPLTKGRRAVRHICLVDEAHVVLASGLPALGNLIRMSRSKGGVVVLISQSPNDFEGEDDAFLDNVGLTLAFNTNAKAGPTARIFGKGQVLTALKPGEALCRIRVEAKTRRVTAWQP